MTSHILNQSIEEHRAISRTSLGSTPAEQREAARLRGAIGRRVQLAEQYRRWGKATEAAQFTREANRLRLRHERVMAAREQEEGCGEPATQQNQVAGNALAQGARGAVGRVPGMEASLPPADWTPGTTLAARL